LPSKLILIFTTDVIDGSGIVDIGDPAVTECMPICCKHYESVGAFPCRAGRARERRRNYEVARRERGCQSCAVCTRHQLRQGCAARPETGGGTRRGLPPVGQDSLQRCSKLPPIIDTASEAKPLRPSPSCWASMRSSMRLSALLARAISKNCCHSTCYFSQLNMLFFFQHA
jgi:hypothetical protein